MEIEKDVCPVVKVDGFIEQGKQFDIEIVVPKDDRNVIYGVLKDDHGDVISDAVIKLIEIVQKFGEDERRPVSHTVSDKNGEFVFGPLCPDSSYEIQVWVDRVKHIKICADCPIRKKKCLKGTKLEPCKRDNKPCCNDSIPTFLNLNKTNKTL